MSTSPWQRGGVGHSQQGLAQDHRQALLQHQAQSSFLYKSWKSINQSNRQTAGPGIAPPSDTSPAPGSVVFSLQNHENPSINQTVKQQGLAQDHCQTLLQHQAQSSFLYKHHKQYINQSSFCIQTYWYYQDLNCKHIGMFMYCFLTYNLKQIFCLNYWSDPDPRY